MTILRACGMSKFETHRDIVKQITHGRGRTVRTRLASALHNLAATPCEPERGLLFIQCLRLDSATEQSQFRDGGNTGQRLATKTKRAQMIEVFHAGKLAGRMPTRDSLHLL